MKLLFKVGTHALQAIDITSPPKVGDKLTITTDDGERRVLVDEIRETNAGTVFFVQQW